MVPLPSMVFWPANTLRQVLAALRAFVPSGLHRSASFLPASNETVVGRNTVDDKKVPP